MVNPSTNIATADDLQPGQQPHRHRQQGVLTGGTSATGAVVNVGGNNGVIPLNPKFGTMPTGAGREIDCFAYSSVNIKDRGIAGSSIATMQYSNGTFSNLRGDRQSSAGNNDSKYYPTFSDSKWIAFASATGGNSDNNNLARLADRAGRRQLGSH